jgi:SAM-dependent methyltransferase
MTQSSPVPTPYLLLLAPSANRVYAEAAIDLTVAELSVFARTVLSGRIHDVAATTVAGLDCVGFSASALTPDDIAMLANLSSAYALFEVAGELLRPVELRRLAWFDDDLITIPKYAGKTNEQFTQLLLNVTLLSSAWASSLVEGGLRVLDPLSGRGTTLNQALVYGYDVAGIDLDGKDYEAYVAYLRTYLQRKRIKHKLEANPVRREKRIVARRLTASITRDERTLSVDVVHADTTAATDFFKPESFHAIVADAPYGVAHGSRTVAAGLRRSPLQLLTDAVPGWARLLRPGGAMGISWNTHVARREAAAEVLAAAGLTVLDDGPYGQLRHRVDAAITRDVLVATKGRTPS